MGYTGEQRVTDLKALPLDDKQSRSVDKGLPLLKGKQMLATPLTQANMWLP